MKIIKKVNVYPEIDNDMRQEVHKWCEETFGPKGWITEDEWVWFSSSNYDRSKYASFDMTFKNPAHATMFTLKWGGRIQVDSEGTEIIPEVFNSLFE